MKKGRKLFKLCICLMLAFAVTLTAGCFSGEIGPNGPSGGSRTKVNVAIFNAGFGTDWLYEMEKVYEAANKNTDIEIKTTVMPWQLLDQIEGGLDTVDIFMGVSPLYDRVKKGSFITLDDLYEMKPAGESKTVEEKLAPEMLNEMRYDGHYIAVPWANGITGMTVNHTTMKAVFGANYELPRTTDEFIGVAGQIKSAGHYAMVSYQENGTYMEYMLSSLWAQYDVDAYDGYYTGKYFDGTVWKDADAGQSLTQPGKLAALNVCETLAKSSNGYMHSSALSMSFAEMQAAFAGLGYGFADKKLVAFCPNGNWLENEIKRILTEQEAAGKPQDIRFMKMPVISAIKDKCSSIGNDAELSALIKAIDGGSDALSGTGYTVTQEDFSRVKRARFMVQENGSSHQAGITSNCKNKDLAKGFLTFLASDAAGQIFAEKTNGLSLPYGYVPNDMTKFSPFVQSVYDVMNGCEFVKKHGLTKPVINGLFYTNTYSSWMSSLFSGTATAQSIYDGDISYYTSQWQYLIA